MVSKVRSAALAGLNGQPVTVEADVSDGLPCFEMAGALSQETREAALRVRTAIKNAGFRLPPRRVVVNIAPGHVKKHGTAFDLPIAVAVLTALEVIPEENVRDCFFAGELGLGGELRPVRGVLAMTASLGPGEVKTIFVPKENAEEAAVCKIGAVCGANSIGEVIRILRREIGFDPVVTEPEKYLNEQTAIRDFREIGGQKVARRAAEIAAAGHHNLLLYGPPGAGKTMIASCIPGILPRLSLEESLEISRIYSIAGLLPEGKPIVGTRPFRAPHHTIPVTALSGGGRIPHPGEISLASGGVLFLDEFPELGREVLEAMRQPLEERKVLIARNYGTVEFPANFMLVAAMNPCPCGFYPDRNRCKCTDWQVRRYQDKLSRPLLDRIDLRIRIGRLAAEELENIKEGTNESSEAIRARVEQAAEIQKERFCGTEIRFNSEIPGSLVSDYCAIDAKSHEYLRKAADRMKMSARGYQKTLRIARTIADLSGDEKIRTAHIKEAMLYRTEDIWF